jgi:uncharacterized membrane protein YdcZ (DUF606 family)
MALIDRYGWVLLILAAAVLVAISTKASGRLAESYGEDPSYWRRVSLAFGVMGYFFVSLMLRRRHGKL